MTTTNSTATVNASRIASALDAFSSDIREAMHASAEESVSLMLANGWDPAGDTYEIGSMSGDQQTAEERIGRKLDRSEIRALELTIRAMLAAHTD